MNPPKQHSLLRTWIGFAYHRILKHLDWRCSGKKFARRRAPDDLAHEVFRHQSPLLRSLKDVDMRMQLNKIKNLELAVQKVDGLIIKPGEIFSYWLLIGNPTASKGYLSGMVLDRGRVRSGTGGGLCQLSNLIFWMTLHVPLRVTERWRHSYDVFPDADRTQPFGSGATCSYPNLDLQFKNETSAVFQLRLELTKTHLAGRWLSDKPLSVRYAIEEQDHAIQHEPWGGYTRHNRLIRKTYDLKTGKLLLKELVAENQAAMMYEPLLESSSS